MTQISKTQKFTNARLNAVQALYAAQLSDMPITKIIFVIGLSENSVAYNA